MRFFLIFILLISLHKVSNAQNYAPIFSPRNLVMVTNGDIEGQGILFAKNMEMKELYLLVSKSTLDSKSQNSGMVIISQYFTEVEKKFLERNKEHCQEIEPLTITVNYQLLSDSSSWIRINDSSDIAVIKIFDRENGLPERYVSFGSICSLQPYFYEMKGFQEQKSSFEIPNKAYFYSENREYRDPRLMNIEIVTNEYGKKLLPLMGTDYTSKILFKKVGEQTHLYGLVNKHQEVFEIDLEE